MPRKAVSFAALMLILGAVPTGAPAQDQPSAQARKTSTGAPVTYVYGNAVPVTPGMLARVRRHIAGIGPGHATQQVVYTVVLVLPQGDALPAQTPSLQATSPPAPGGQLIREDRDRNDADTTRRRGAP